MLTEGLLLVGLSLVALCTAATLFSMVSVYRITGRREPREAPPCPEHVTVLKPLCGLDDELETNLESFFLQRHPSFELVFGAESTSDPALAVVERLQARHPGVRARVVVHGRRGLNAKVANLRGMLAAGASDLVVVSDSNVAVEPDYLTNMVAPLSRPEVGLVTSLFAGAGEHTLGARLESLHLCGPVAGSVAASQVGGGSAVCVGKSMAFRRGVLETLGGLESVSTVLAEDYVIGRMYQEAGYRVLLGRDVVRNLTVSTSIGAFVKRQIRWALLRSRLRPLAYPVELLVNPTAIALLAMLLGAGPWPLLWAALLTMVRDATQWLRLRGPDGLARTLPLGVAKDLLMLGAWAVAPFLPGISWRGRTLRVSAGTRVYGRV